jgi:hypothetical protein
MKALTTFFLLTGILFTIDANVLTIRENLFYLNGEHFEMWGLRTASATQSDALTDLLLDALDEYQEVGLNTINIYLQGSSGGYSDPFNRNGTRIDKDHWDRLVRIIEEFNRRSMVVVVGIFYQRTMADEDGVRNLANNERSVYNAVKTVTEKLKPYGNVILNIANEHNSNWYRHFTGLDFRDPENIIALCRHAKEIDPERIVGGGGYSDEPNIIIGKSEYVDVLLFDTFSGDIEKDQDSGWKYDYFRENGVAVKPMVNVETFGGWTRSAMPPGVYGEEMKRIHFLEVEAAVKRPGLSVHLHSNPWCQGPSLGNYPVRFDLGGMGTEDDPGIRWWYEYIRTYKNKTERVQPFAGNPFYLAWGDTPVFPLGPTGYHAWTPISRPGTVDSHEQLYRLSRVIDGIGSPHVVGFVRCLPYDPNNHMHDGEVVRVLQPWVKTDDGRYDLRRFAPEWERRLKDYLDLALNLRIIVSLEVWDDWSVSRGVGGAWDPGPEGAWNIHPFNPRNNINYDSAVLPETTTECNAPFYRTIPSQSDITEVLDLQKFYVDQLLSIVSDYPNVLLNISNESRANLEWSRFWAEYIRRRIPLTMIGEMPSTNRKDGGGECEYLFNPMTLSTDPRYDYVDIAQAVSGHEFGGNAQRQALEGSMRIAEYRAAMKEAGTERPLIVSKDYTRGPEGGAIVSWSRFVGGAASARFHRPAGDHPESVIIFQHEMAGHLGRFIARVPFWQMDMHHGVIKVLPSGAGGNVLTDLVSHYVIQLLGGSEGEKLELQLSPGNWSVSWIDPSSGTEFANNEAVVNSSTMELNIQGVFDHRIIYITKN